MVAIGCLKKSSSQSSFTTREYLEKMAVIEAEQKKITKDFISAAAELAMPIREYVRDSSLLSDLLTSGHHVLLLHYNSNVLGFKDLDDIKKQFESLCVAWRRNIHVGYSDHPEGVIVFIAVH